MLNHVGFTQGIQDWVDTKNNHFIFTTITEIGEKRYHLNGCRKSLS